MEKPNLVEKTQALIKEMIQNREYDKNNYLPSEGDLCERFGVSRATVREAVKSMEVRGFLRREHGKGLVVTHNPVKVMTRFLQDMLSMDLSDMVELMEVRRIIEVEAAGLAAERAKKEHIDSLRKAVVAMERAETMDDDYHANDFDFHITMINASGNNLLYTFINAITPLLRHLVAAASQKEDFIERRRHYHRNIFDSIAASDAEGAIKNMRDHFRSNIDIFLQTYTEQYRANEFPENLHERSPGDMKKR